LLNEASFVEAEEAKEKKVNPSTANVDKREAIGHSNFLYRSKGPVFAVLCRLYNH
jgi:hypothetical protein